MRGSESQQGSMFSYVDLESRIPKSHPLRRIRRLVDQALEDMSERFDELYAGVGRPSIPPERLLRALLLQILFSIRSERQLMEQLDYNLLFRWFVGLGIDDRVWNPTSFTKNRERLLAGEVAEAFFRAILAHAERQELLSKEHFTVDGTLIDAWASHKSFRPKDEDSPPPDGGANFRGQKRTNDTHQSTTDPQARLLRKGPGKEAKLSYGGHILVENRNGMIVDTEVAIATGNGESTAGLAMLERVPGSHRVTIAADKGYDNQTFVEGARHLRATPHVAQNTSNRRSRIDARTTRHSGYAASLAKRPRVEAPFGWLKQYGLQRRPMFRGVGRIRWAFTFAAATFNVLRLSNLMMAAEAA
ncbi:MAG: IS5 family transposase [Acidobacteriota bacterium]|nr:IS5 family transposase [Acidobacteriota bacterium]